MVPRFSAPAVPIRVNTRLQVAQSDSAVVVLAAAVRLEDPFCVSPLRTEARGSTAKHIVSARQRAKRRCTMPSDVGPVAPVSMTSVAPPEVVPGPRPVLTESVRQRQRMDATPQDTGSAAMRI